MINHDDLLASFSDVVDLGDGFLSCCDVMPKRVLYYYLLADRRSTNRDFLMISENFDDGNFAKSTISSLSYLDLSGGMEKIRIPRKEYGFNNVLLVPSSYHSYFKGRLDQKRDALIWCVPIYNCEFSGSETAQEFEDLRSVSVPVLNWRREIHPRILLRFDNPRTKGGTGDKYVFVNYKNLIAEVTNLSGVSSGFIEIVNYLGDVMEILSVSDSGFAAIFDRNDKGKVTMSDEDLGVAIWKFITL